jgi:hypothetical protein
MGEVRAKIHALIGSERADHSLGAGTQPRILSIEIEAAMKPGVSFGRRPIPDRRNTLIHRGLFKGKASTYGLRLVPGNDVTYGLMRQRIAMSGPFEYEYGWLSSTAEPKNMRDFAARHFEKVYGVHPDNLELVLRASPGARLFRICPESCFPEYGSILWPELRLQGLGWLACQGSPDLENA